MKKEEKQVIRIDIQFINKERIIRFVDPKDKNIDKVISSLEDFLQNSFINERGGTIIFYYDKECILPSVININSNVLYVDISKEVK